MASNALPVPAPLEIHDSNAADKWRKFLAAWENYALAGEDGREVYSTLRDWAHDVDDRRIDWRENRSWRKCIDLEAEYCG